jgi:hypothetical protein
MSDSLEKRPYQNLSSSHLCVGLLVVFVAVIGGGSSEDDAGDEMAIKKPRLSISRKLRPASRRQCGLRLDFVLLVSSASVSPMVANVVRHEPEKATSVPVFR